MYKKKTAVKRPYKKRAYKRHYKKTGAAKLVTKAQLYKAINKTTETKQATAEFTWTQFNSAISSASEYLGILPGLGAGVGPNQRVGDQVRPKRLVIRGVISFVTDAPSYNGAVLLISKLFCFQSKNTRYIPQVSTTLTTNLITNGGNPSPFTGALLDITRPLNKEEFTFYKTKQHTFLKPWGLTNQAITNVNVDMTSVDKSLVYYFTITLTQKELPAVLKYTGSAETYPINFAPLLALGYANSTNATPDTLFSRLGMSYSSTLYYEDA